MKANRYPSTIAELIRRRASQSPSSAAYARRVAPGQWETINWSEFWEELRQAASLLSQLGLGPGDYLAIMARTRPEWHLLEHAGMLTGAAIVGIDPHASPSHIRRILAETGPRVLVCDTCTDNLVSAITSDTFVIQLDTPGQSVPGRNVRLWSQRSQWMTETQVSGLPKVRPDDPATLIYTSGTTGDPKAIRFTHRQLLVACQALAEVYPLDAHDSTLCWLPMAHLFQRMMNLVATSQGSVMHFVEDPREVVVCAGEVNPAIHIGVPRFYEKLREGIEGNLGGMPSWRRRLVNKAIRTSLNYHESIRNGKKPSWFSKGVYRQIDRHVLRKIRAVMGSRMRYMITGSAPIAPSLLEYFSAIGWTVYEAYGISENTVPMAANRPGAVRFGSVGKPFSQNKLRFAKDGEILVKGEGLFDGYWNESGDRNRLTEDGYYRTGDLGRLEGDGYLYLKGRKSEIIKTSTGRKIAPGKIEAAYAQSDYLNHVTVVGNGRKHLAALCTLNLRMIEKWLREHQLDWPLVESHLAGREEVKRWLGKEYDRFGQGLSPHERVVEFAILPQQLSIEKGELTPSLKVRRNAIESNYFQEINRLYEGVSEKNRYQQEATVT